MAIDYTALRNEIENDPATLGYAPMRANGNDTGIAALLNQVRSTIKINTGKITTDQLKACVVLGEYTGLSVANRQWLDFVAGAQFIDLNHPTVVNGLSALFGAGTTTRTNILAAQQRDGSRAEQLFGSGTHVSDVDVANSRTLLAPTTPGW